MCNPHQRKAEPASIHINGWPVSPPLSTLHSPYQFGGEALLLVVPGITSGLAGLVLMIPILWVQGARSKKKMAI